MEEGLLYLIIIGVVLYLLYLFIVYVILPIAGFLLASGIGLMVVITGTGVVSGLFVGIKNFANILLEAHKELP